jgi:alpha-ketoglutarate-dependent taurine dioxygenase
MAHELTPLHEAVGVEIAGLDLGDGSASNAVAALRDGVHRHGCALLRDQELAPATLARLGRALGKPLPPYRPQYSLPDFPEIVRVGNTVEGGAPTAYLNRGGVEWHSDSPGSARPPEASLLLCLESVLPDGGGETGFASTVSGYRALPDALKARIENLELVHSFNTFNDRVARYRDSAVPAQAGTLRTRNRDTRDRIVQCHPATGQRHLYVSHAMVKAVPGLEFEDGLALVMEVVRHATAPHLVYKHVWRPGDLMVFDNRSCLHTPFPYAYDDYPRTRRLLHQIIVGGRRDPVS